MIPDQVTEVIFERVFDGERLCERFTFEEAFEFVINDALLVELATQQSPDPDVELGVMLICTRRQPKTQCCLPDGLVPMEEEDQDVAVKYVSDSGDCGELTVDVHNNPLQNATVYCFTMRSAILTFVLSHLASR